MTRNILSQNSKLFLNLSLTIEEIVKLEPQPMCELLCIKKSRTIPVHHYSYGMIKMYHRTSGNTLRVVNDENESNWNECSPLFPMICRFTTHESTGSTTANNVFGGQLRFPVDILIDRPNNSNISQ